MINLATSPSLQLTSRVLSVKEITFCKFAVVQEQICWFEQFDPESLCTVATSVRDLIP